MTIIFLCFFLHSTSESTQSEMIRGRSRLKLESNPDWLLRPPLIAFIITIRSSESSESDSESVSDFIRIRGIICSIPIGWLLIVCIIIISIKESDVELSSFPINSKGSMFENCSSVLTLQSEELFKFKRKVAFGWYLYEKMDIFLQDCVRISAR